MLRVTNCLNGNYRVSDKLTIQIANSLKAAYKYCM